MINRRRLVQGLGASSALAVISGCAMLPRSQSRARARVVVVGGGFGGASAAGFVRTLSGHSIDVILVEPNAQFVSSPLSNLVVGGELELKDITRSYGTLARRDGVTIIRDRATSIDFERRTLALAAGHPIHYDKLVLSPGIDLMFDSVDGLAQANRDGRILAAWSAGPETAALRQQLLAMPDGGVFVITVPEAPYRCPPAPYERASLVAAYLQQHKPRSKVLVLDANQDVIAMGGLFRQAWAERYGALLEYRNHYKVVAVDAKSRTLRFDVQDDVRADVLNVLPPERAGALAVQAGLANVNGRWCAVDFRSFAAAADPHVHVLGDSIQAAPMMPKTGHMARAHAAVAAAAIVAELQGRDIDPAPKLSNVCYSFVSAAEAIHSSSAYDYVPDAATYKTVAGAGSVAAAPSTADADRALTWAYDTWAAMLA
jgi:NADPH-dependent 2,4-dienoyl-CoA reductase/sulfur reductase-like enzyme